MTAANALSVRITTSVGFSDFPFSALTLTETGELVVTSVRELVVLKLPLITPFMEETSRNFETSPYLGSAMTRSQIVEGNTSALMGLFVDLKVTSPKRKADKSPMSKANMGRSAWKDGIYRTAP